MSGTSTAEVTARIKAVGRRKVIISFVYPPIPHRQFDYCAYFENDEPNDDGHMLCGYGKTKEQALLELLDAVENVT